MDKIKALTAFSALGQDTRLEVFRLLVKAGQTGMTAGLVRNEREGRSVRYFADMEGVGGLLGFLMEDCCAGNPALCQPVIDQIACPAASSNAAKPKIRTRAHV